MSLDDLEDKKLKSECTRLVHGEGMYSCMVMMGPPPLFAELTETWDSSYDAYCERCVRFLHPDSVGRDWTHILEERSRLWMEKRKKWMNENARS